MEDKKIIVYHGSKARFDTFRLDYMGSNATDYGQGIYFSKDKEIALQYAENGYLYTCEISILKPLSSNSITMTPADVEKLIKSIDETTDFLTNYGDVKYDGYSTMMQRAVTNLMEDNKTDIELIGSMCNSSGEYEEILKAVNTTLGYDHSVQNTQESEEVYVVLNPDTITITNVESALDVQAEEVAEVIDDRSKWILGATGSSESGLKKVIMDLIEETEPNNPVLEDIKVDPSSLGEREKIEKVDISQSQFEVDYKLPEDARVIADMDGVLFKFDDQLPSLDLLFQKGYFTNLKPQEKVIEALRKLIVQNPGQVYICSAAVDSPYAIPEKMESLKTHLPELPEEQMLFINYGSDQSKVDVIPGGVRKSDILLDDYGPNLTQWDDAGGTAVKIVNDINDKTMSWSGHRLHYLSDGLLGEMVDITKEMSVTDIATNLQLGTLKITIEYSSINQEHIKEEISELTRRMVGVVENENPINVELSMTMDGKPILHREMLAKEDIQQHISQIKDGSQNLFVKIAEGKIRNSLQNDALEDLKSFDENIKKYNDLSTLDKSLIENEDVLVLEESISIS